MKLRLIAATTAVAATALLAGQGVASAATGTISPHVQQRESGSAFIWTLTWSGGTSAYFKYDDANTNAGGTAVISGHQYAHTFCDVTPHSHEDRLDVNSQTGLSLFHTLSYAQTTTDC